VNGKKVADFGDGTPNMSFGELALLYNSPRAATVISRTPSKLWAIDRRTFRGIVAKSSHAQHSRLKTTLRRGILEDLTDEQITKVAR
jgi:cAMP-dependent protein kinase regulator